MADKVRCGRGVDDRGAVRKADDRRRVVPEARGTASTERMGREQQRRATAHVEDTYVYVKGLARLGGADLSAYATTKYVDERIAEIQSLEEVQF